MISPEAAHLRRQHDLNVGTEANIVQRRVDFQGLHLDGAVDAGAKSLTFAAALKAKPIHAGGNVGGDDAFDVDAADALEFSAANLVVIDLRVAQDKFGDILERPGRRSGCSGRAG